MGGIKMEMYSLEPENRHEYQESSNRFYTRFARLYDIAVRVLPFWKAWLRHALPYLQGPRVLEVSFGTGCLLTQFADRFEAHGIDYNEMMVRTAQKNLAKASVDAALLRGDVASLPYKDKSFDSIVNTMAFSGFPDGRAAMSEMRRVLKRGGRLILIDVNYPPDGNWLGTRLTNLWKRTGDIIRPMGDLFREFNFHHTDEEIGGFGSVHLYVATKGGGS